MYFAKTPILVQRILKRLVWRFVDAEEVFLTFDDGPIPEVTPFVLDLLQKENIKATFFCVGDNVRKHPEIYQRIIDEGHSIGNHTYHHLNAWKTSNETYLDDIKKADEVIDSKLFRPPYGKISPHLISKLKDQYDIIMWDVLSGDFDPKITADKCYDNVTKNAKHGSIIVFHDSIKAFEKLKIVLPSVISFFKEKGVQLKKICLLYTSPSPRD